MSQKTNPLSLRLQKTSRNFISPWFADFFWGDTYLKSLEIENYSADLAKQAQFSKAFVSIKSFYRKSYVYLVIEDNRFEKKENIFLLKKKSLASPQKTSKKRRFTVHFFNKNKKDKLVFTIFNPKTIFNDASSKLLSSKIKKKTVSSSSKVKSEFIISKKSKRFTLVEDQTLLTNKKKFVRFWIKKQLLFVNCFSFCEKIACLPSSTKQLQFHQFSFSSFFVSASLKRNEKKAEKARMTNLACTSSSTIFAAKSNKLEKNEVAYVLNNSPQTKVASIFFLQTTAFSFNDNNLSGFFPVTVFFQPIRFLCCYQSVMALMDRVIDLLEKRIPFRQIQLFLFKNLVYNNYIEAIRISCSGRVGGRSKKAQKAKMQCASLGKMCLSSLSSKIVFHSKSAYTRYGKLGVKIWLSFNDQRGEL